MTTTTASNRRGANVAHSRAHTIGIAWVSIALIIACKDPVAGQSGQVGRDSTPRIVHGSATAEYPSVGVLLIYDNVTASGTPALCSGTLIGCRSFVTAAHCVCPENTENSDACLREGMSDARSLRVFLPNGGVFNVSNVAISPDYTFAVRGDVALLTLAEDVTGIAPLAVNSQRRLVSGTTATIVGFGTTQGGRRSIDDSGIKRQGKVVTAPCPSDVPNDQHVCWSYTGSDSNACFGDSGGPLLVDFGSGLTVAGITSGGYSDACSAPDTGFDTDVFVNLAWITGAAGSDVGTASCGLAAVGSESVTTTLRSGAIATSGAQTTVQFEVAAGTNLLRVALNGQVGSGSGPSEATNDFDFYVLRGAAPTTTSFDCADTNTTPFGFCQIEAPTAGTWHVLIQSKRGAGEFQVNATAFAGPKTSCAGDCDADGVVTIDELSMVSDLSNHQASAYCPSVDLDGDSTVSIQEYEAALTNALRGCANR